MTIYYIENKINGKLLIGLTTKSVRKRMRIHVRRLNNKTHCNKYLTRSWHKYGKENFKLGILETGLKNLNELCEAEEFWINTLQTMCPNGYNLTTGGIFPRFSEKQKRERRKNYPKGKEHHNYGKPGICSGTKRPQMRRKFKTDKSKSGDKNHRTIEVIQLDLSNNFIRTWVSATKAGKELGIHQQHISSVCKGKRISTGGFKWEYSR